MRRARESIGSLTFELSPPLLYDVGLVATADWLADNLVQRYGLRTTVEKRGEVPALDEAQRVTLYRALRELLINVAKHAGTKEAQVLIEGSASGVSVSVRDHGFGFDPQAPADGFGLRSIRERIESLGGRFAVESAPDRGTQVVLSVPASGRSAT
jgi:signal transduction histidine kinase